MACLRYQLCHYMALHFVIQMYMLSCMIGPPSGLNLRNILWHGFISSSEISQELVMLNLPYTSSIVVHSNFRYAYLFFIVVSSLGKMLQSAPASIQFNHRPFITFPQETRFANIFPGEFVIPILYILITYFTMKSYRA